MFSRCFQWVKQDKVGQFGIPTQQIKIDFAHLYFRPLNDVIKFWDTLTVLNKPYMVIPCEF